MNMLEKIQADLRESMKAKDEVKVSTLRFLISAIHNAKIEKGQDLTDEDIVGVIQKQIKQRKESIEGFEQGGRADLVEKEKKELAILQEYLPAQLSSSEIEEIIDIVVKELSASTPSDMGKVMGKLSQELKGKADMSEVSSIVRQKLDLISRESV